MALISVAPVRSRTSSTARGMVRSIEIVGTRAGDLEQGVQESAATIEQMAASVESTARHAAGLTSSVGTTTAVVAGLICCAAVVTAPGEWVRYSTPEPGGAEYLAVCLPAFSPGTVHRDPGA